MWDPLKGLRSRGRGDENQLIQLVLGCRLQRWKQDGDYHSYTSS